MSGNGSGVVRLVNGMSSACMIVSDADYDDYADESALNVSACNCSDQRFVYVPACGCDYPEAPAPPLVEVLPPGVVYVIVFLLGTAGNSLVILVVSRYKKMRNVTNIFLASLSTADLLLIWLCVPIMYAKYLSYTWLLGKVLCYFVHYVQQLIMCCSVLTLTTISIERYSAIAYPMRSMWISSVGRAKKIIALIWLSSVVCALPTAMRLDYITATTMNNHSIAWCVKRFPPEWAHSQAMEKTYALYQFLLLLVVPLATMTFCYTRVALIVNESSHNESLHDAVSARRALVWRSIGSFRRKTSKTNYHTMIQKCPSPTPSPTPKKHIKKVLQRKSSRICDTNKTQIVQMLIAIVVLYTICWTPTIVDELLVGFNLLCGTSITTDLKYMRMAFAALAYSQSCINPVVYAFMSQNFRATFLATCAIWWRRRFRRARNNSYSNASLISGRAPLARLGHRLSHSMQQRFGRRHSPSQQDGDAAAVASRHHSSDQQERSDTFVLRVRQAEVRLSVHAETGEELWRRRGSVEHAPDRRDHLRRTVIIRTAEELSAAAADAHSAGICQLTADIEHSSAV